MQLCNSLLWQWRNKFSVVGATICTWLNAKVNDYDQLDRSSFQSDDHSTQDLEQDIDPGNNLLCNFVNNCTQNNCTMRNNVIKLLQQEINYSFQKSICKFQYYQGVNADIFTTLWCNYSIRNLNKHWIRNGFRIGCLWIKCEK